MKQILTPPPLLKISTFLLFTFKHESFNYSSKYHYQKVNGMITIDRFNHHSSFTPNLVKMSVILISSTYLGSIQLREN